MMEETIHSIKESRKLAEGIELVKLLAAHTEIEGDFKSEEIDDWESYDVYEYLESFGYYWDGYLGWAP